MYEIKTQAFFSAAHHLLNYDGECENQHGHNWMVEAYVKGETLDKSNILIDYKVLKKELNAVLDLLDHKDINEVPEFKGESPSSEMISAFIYTKLKERIPNTLLLTTIVIFLTWLVGIPLGVVAALNWKSPLDRILTVLTSIGMAIPSFFFAVLLLIFAVKTGWFPVGGLTSSDFLEKSFLGQVWDVTHHLILPVTVLFTLSLAGLQRQMRANLLDVLDSDYIKFARAKGLSEFDVIFKHALRNAINPMITLLGFEFAGLLSGAALTEYVFQYPGLGRLILEAVMRSDINLVMASLMMGAIMLILGNLIADILLIITDPRIRRSNV